MLKNPVLWGLWGGQKWSIPFRESLSPAWLCSNIAVFLHRVRLVLCPPTDLLLTAYGRAIQEKEIGDGTSPPIPSSWDLPSVHCLKGNNW